MLFAVDEFPKIIRRQRTAVFKTRLKSHESGFGRGTALHYQLMGLLLPRGLVIGSLKCTRVQDQTAA